MFLMLALLAVAAYLIFKWSTRNFDYFEKQGVQYVKPYPLIGTNLWLTGRENIALVIQRFYNQYSRERIFGMFSFNEPFYAICDPSLIKQLAVKDFDHFPNRLAIVDASFDEILGNILSFMRNKRWKDMRSALSPLFTGSKMRMMFGLMSEAGEQMCDHLTKENAKFGPICYDVKDIFSRYANDVIATCAFGIKCDSFENPENEFFLMGQSLSRFANNPLQVFKFLMIRYFPRVAKIFGLSIFSEETKKLFRRMTIENMNIREKEKIQRPDLINMLLQVRKGELQNEETEKDAGHDSIAAVNEDSRYVGKEVAKKTWNDNEIIAQCFVFFIAGFDTSSGTLRYMAYELATNPDVQDKLIAEIDELYDSLDGKAVNYEQIQSLKYLDLVISETLRKWPAAFLVDRQCEKDFLYKDENGHQFEIKKGMYFWIPIHALHNDPNYFSEPERFDPERFNEENRRALNMDAYLPFGVGPRNCIGSRFALLEMKIAVYMLLRKFRFEVGPETQVPLKLKKTPNGLMPEKDVKLRLMLRRKN